jgi:hypothetical protein
VSVVDEAVEDGIGDAAAAEELMPVTNGELGSDGDCPGAVAFLERFEQILLFPVCEAGETEVIDLCGALHKSIRTKPLRGSRNVWPRPVADAVRSRGLQV